MKWTRLVSTWLFFAGVVTCWVSSGAATPLVVEELAHGSFTRGANGLRFDAADRLHVASFLGREIVVLDADSGDVLERVPRSSDTPDDLVFGPDGSMYWTSLLTGVVTRKAPDGSITSQVVGTSPNAIAASDDGRLFVSECLGGEVAGLYELDPQLVAPPRLITDALGAGCALNAMDFGPDGGLYGPRWFVGDVVRVDVDTAEMTVVTAGFEVPGAVKWGPDGALYVLDYGAGELWRYAPGAESLDLVASLTPGVDNLAFDSHGRLFVSHGVDSEIVEIEPDGAVRVVQPGGMVAPGGLALVPRGHGRMSLWVADSYDLTELDARTGEVLSVEQTGQGGIPLTTPQTVSADGHNLLLTSWLQNRVQVWDPRTRRLLVDLADFALPMDAVRFRGDLVVTEALTGQVVMANHHDLQQRRAVASGLVLPTGLATNGRDLWVSDWATGTIWQLARRGRWLDSPVAIAEGLIQPEGLAVDRRGHLLVVEAGTGSLLRIHRRSHRVRILVDGLDLGVSALPGLLPTWFFNGVDVDRAGRIYVSGDRGRLIYRIKRSRFGGH
ncbi:MAG: SMP-30/gluconolactonase/LRE family protein [Acidobacteriota bacterium]|nr:SMP-30/gluconolactonase/LRE family protein [Acidobacteriota bacterium]